MVPAKGSVLPAPRTARGPFRRRAIARELGTTGRSLQDNAGRFARPALASRAAATRSSPATRLENGRRLARSAHPSAVGARARAAAFPVKPNAAAANRRPAIRRATGTRAPRAHIPAIPAPDCALASALPTRNSVRARNTKPVAATTRGAVPKTVGPDLRVRAPACALAPRLLARGAA